MHICFVIPPYHGHLTSGSTLAGAVKALGHRVTLISSSSIGQIYADRHQLDAFVLLPGHEEAMQEDADRLATLSGLAGLKCTAEGFVKYAKLLTRDLAQALEALPVPVDALMIDEVIYNAATTIAEYMKLPYGILATMISVNHSHDGPSIFLTSSSFATSLSDNYSWWQRFKDTAGWITLDFLMPSTRPAVNEWRQEHGLPIIPSGLRKNGGRIQLTQQPACFEFPKQPGFLPGHFFYTCPWHIAAAAEANDAGENDDGAMAFPFDKLDASKPLIYASLGTVRNQLTQVYRNICQACRNLNQPVQLVVGLGKRGVAVEDILPLSLQDHPTCDIIVVDFAPQRRLLDKASLAITHCGMNTCLETIACGIPALGIPITDDQPGVAARWKSVGAAMVIDAPSQASVDRIQQALEALLPESSSFRKSAKALQTKLQTTAPNLEQTAKLIELAFDKEFEDEPLIPTNRRAQAILQEKQVLPPLRQS